jgi:putative transposase
MSLTSRRTVKRYKPEEIVAKLRQVDVLVSQGQNRVDAIRQIGVSEVTYYRFGGLKTEQVKRLITRPLERASYADVYWVSCKAVYPETGLGYSWGTRA